MFKNLALATLFSFITFQASAQLRVSLITCTAGEDIYSIFGHSAIRVIDSTKGTDLVYNFGMFSFDTDNFLYKFVKGETYYWVEAERFRRFIRSYKHEQRAVYENVWNISQADATLVQAFLNKNILPENRVYLYSYMFDNCATRIRDIAGGLVGDTVLWKGHSEPFTEMPEQISDPEMFSLIYSGTDFTYRDLLNKYLQKIPWVNWGIYFSVAAPSDSEIPYMHSMFLPEFLMNGFQNAVYQNNGTISPLVDAPVLLVDGNSEPQSASVFSPQFVFALLLLVICIVSFFGFRRNRHFWGIDSVLLILLGLYGCAGAFVSWMSIHPATFPNYNMLWANPLHLLVGIFICIAPLRRRFLSITYTVFTCLLLIYFVCVAFQLQALHWANVPLIGAFVVRYYLFGKVSKSRVF